MAAEIDKTDAEWQRQLSPEQYRVCRRKGTEAPFSGEYYRHPQSGDYVCVCCGAPLFSSATQFDAGCGWPSFYAPQHPAGITTAEDHSHNLSRTEVLCSRCGAHLGHVFPDGPPPTGLRYCVNSVALKLIPAT